MSRAALWVVTSLAVSAMAGMSRAIREECQKHAPTLALLPEPILRELTQIVGAFYFDLKGELDKREGQS